MVSRILFAVLIVPWATSAAIFQRAFSRHNAIIHSTSRGGFNEIPRGGAKKSKHSPIDINEVKTTRLQNIVRSVMEVTQRKTPILGKVFKHMIRMAESLTGATLLPPSKSKAHKKSKGEKKKSKTQSEDEKQSSSKSLFLPTSAKKNSPDIRIQTELRKFLSDSPPNLKLKVGRNIRVWIVTLSFPETSIYYPEKYRLRISFPSQYPSVPPSVYFLQPTPRHEHVYTNGDICLSLLGKDWRPTMTAQSIAISIASILNGAREKSLPMDNSKHCGNKPGGRQDDWVYHDDNC
mmetsp:Transcript_20852/g.25814  ORF Transcript_20852/g.25814 Transcript_20852/m.25814 type:complete len:291 (-) Transcript_20852:435-1307(-)